MSDQPILTQVENKVATLTLNRPDKLRLFTKSASQISKDAEVVPDFEGTVRPDFAAHSFGGHTEQKIEVTAAVGL